MFAKYLERLQKFRNPKIKNITLYREIEKEFKVLGYPNIKADAIDKNMRNMKSTYKCIKNNKKNRTSSTKLGMVRRHG